MAKLKIFRRGNNPEQKEKKKFLQEARIPIYSHEVEKIKNKLPENGIEYDIRKDENGNLFCCFEEEYYDLVYDIIVGEEEETVNCETENENIETVEELQKPSLASTIANSENIVATNVQKVKPIVKQGKTVNTKVYEPTQNELSTSSEDVDEEKTDEKSLAEQSPEELKQYFGILTIEEQEHLDKQKAREVERKKEPAKRQKLGRNHEVKTRLTEGELKLFRERVKKSRLKQGDFMRSILLNEEVHVHTLTEIDEQAFIKIMDIAADLGRIGGLIKGTVMANRDNFVVLTPESKEEFEKEIKELNKLKEDLQKAVQWVYGNSETRS